MLDTARFNSNEPIDLVPLLAPPLRELWDRFPSLAPWTVDGTGFLPPFYPTYAQVERVIVLGLNPSYSANDRGLVSFKADEAGNGYFRRMAGFMHQAAAAYQQLTNDSPKSHQPLYCFDELNWLHLDLLYMRTTSQRALVKQVWHVPRAAAFVWEQLQLTKKLLAQLEPTLLVIANSFGRTLSGFEKTQATVANEWMGLQFTTLPDESGAYRITGSTTAGIPDSGHAAKLAGTPVFFTGSFAGTHPRSAVVDGQLIQQIAACYLRESDRYFAQWHLH